MFFRRFRIIFLSPVYPGLCLSFVCENNRLKMLVWQVPVFMRCLPALSRRVGSAMEVNVSLTSQEKVRLEIVKDELTKKKERQRWIFSPNLSTHVAFHDAENIPEVVDHFLLCSCYWFICRTNVFRDNQSSYNQLLERAKLPILHNRRLQDICILMYKVKHNLCPRTVRNIFKTSNHSYSLRQTDSYLPNFNTVTYGKHSLRYLGPKLWSKLASSERSSASLYNLKVQIRKRDLSNILEGCNSCHLCNS